MDKTMKEQHDQKVINNLNMRLNMIESALMTVPNDDVSLEIKLRERDRIRMRLMRLYGTEKYALLLPN